MAYVCSCCGETHDEMPDIGYRAPHYWTDPPRPGASLSSDLCVLDDDRFVRGVLELPVLGTNETFGWGVWVSLSQANFERYKELFADDPPPGEAPYFGWLANKLPRYPDTLNLKSRVHLRSKTTRPMIELEPTDHPLAVHQRRGIRRDELMPFINSVLHPHDKVD